MVDGMSIREAARTIGLHRDTVRKMLAYSVPPSYQRQTPSGRPKLEPFTGIIDQILVDDLRRPRKQRHTAQRIFQRLRDEHGELALCVLLFILFFALSWGALVLWDEVFINTSDTAPETVHAVLTGAGRMAVSSAVLAVAAVYTGKGIVIMAKFFARRRPGPEATPRNHGEALDTLEIPVACHGGGKQPAGRSTRRARLPQHRRSRHRFNGPSRTKRRARAGAPRRPCGSLKAIAPPACTE